MQYYTISGTITELITLDQAKYQLRIDPIVMHEDTEITSYITEAREIAENYIGRLIGERTLTIASSDFVQMLSYYTPINSVTSIVAKVNNTDVNLAEGDNYKLRDLSPTEQRIIYVSEALPTLDDIDTPVTTVLKVGYNATNCPKSIISAMKLIISKLYEHREDSAQPKTMASHNILRTFKKWY